MQENLEHTKFSAYEEIFLEIKDRATHEWQPVKNLTELGAMTISPKRMVDALNEYPEIEAKLVNDYTDENYPALVRLKEQK